VVFYNVPKNIFTATNRFRLGFFSSFHKNIFSLWKTFLQDKKKSVFKEEKKKGRRKFFFVLKLTVGFIELSTSFIKISTI
jgi:hypothetical protein